MFQKQEIIHSKIQMLFSEIYQRHTLQNDNLYRICLDQCACRNLIFDMGDHVWDKKRLDFERKIIDLEQEKRREQTGYFKDVLFLRKELRETLIEKLEDKQKSDLFKDSGEELTMPIRLLNKSCLYDMLPICSERGSVKTGRRMGWKNRIQFFGIPTTLT